MQYLSIDIETYSSVNLQKAGVYKYAESPDFDILLFGYSVDGGAVHVIDLACGEKIPAEIVDALSDESVTKWAFNAQFERVCLSNYLDTWLSPASWHCTMVWSATLGLPLSLEGVGAVLGLEKQKLTEGKNLIKYFCVPCAPTKTNGGRTRNLPLHDMEKWEQFKAYNQRDVETEMSIQKKLSRFTVPDFIWDEYCDWYIEMVKPRLYNKEDSTRAAALWTLKQVLINALKLMHPFMPFITEELFMHIQDEEETIMTSQWPVYKEEWNFKENEAEIDAIKEAVRNIRNIRAEMNVAPSKKVHVYVVSENEGVRYIFEHSKVFFKTLAHASEVTVQTDKAGIGEDAVSVVVQDATIYMPLAELVDFAKEIERLEKEKTKLEKEVDRVVKKLANQGFVAKAPAHVIEEEKAKEEKYKAMLAQVEERLAQLKK